MPASTQHRFLKAALAALSALLLASCGEKQARAPSAPPPPAVSVANPVEKRVVEWDEYTGRFDAVDTVEVRARISGVLTEVKFTDGAIVKKGDLLLVIDPRPFQRVLDRDRAALQGAKVQLDFAQKDLERAKPLVANNTISQQGFDQRNQAVKVAEANVLSAEASVRSAELDVEFTQIRAPIAGRIGRKLVSEGNFITGGSGSGTLLTTIVSIDPIYFYFDISEADFLKYKRLLEQGMRPSSRETANPIEVGLQGDAGFPIKGKMNFVDNRIDTATGSLRERATFENPNGNLLPGLFAHARVIGSGEYTAILLPDEAIATDQSNRFVFVVADDGAVGAKSVALGPLIDGLRVIRSGVTPTDWVIVNGVQRARKGIKVKPEKTVIEQNAKAASLP
ncbi:MAG: efflux RND transporter periplasmic adaptor subunit [Rhodomicrobium sp.]